MRTPVLLAILLAATPSLAQPAAGSGGGAPVGPSVSQPRAPTGATPPGAPSSRSVPGQIARDATGQSVIGHTTTPPSAVPGNTGGQGTGAQTRRP